MSGFGKAVMLREGALVIQRLLRQRVRSGDGYGAPFEKVLAVADVLVVLDPSSARKDSVARASLQALFDLYPDLEARRSPCGGGKTVFAAFREARWRNGVC